MFETFSASGLEISEKSCQISKSFLSFPFFQPSKNIVHDIQSETQRNVVDVQHRILHISWILKTRFSKESYESRVRRQKCTIAFAGRFRTISLSLKGLFCLVSAVAAAVLIKVHDSFQTLSCFKVFFSFDSNFWRVRDTIATDQMTHFNIFCPPNQFFVFDVAFCLEFRSHETFVHQARH